MICRGTTHEKLTNAFAFKALRIHRQLLLALALQTQCSQWLSTTSAQHFHRSSKKPTSSQTQFGDKPTYSAFPTPTALHWLLHFKTQIPMTRSLLLFQPAQTTNRRTNHKAKLSHKTKANAMLSRAGHTARASEETVPASA